MEREQRKKTTTRDMTSGPIVRQVVLFCLPLMLGNIFQMLYNTVDSVVVGNFVGTAGPGGSGGDHHHRQYAGVLF